MTYAALMSLLLILPGHEAWAEKKDYKSFRQMLSRPSLYTDEECDNPESCFFTAMKHLREEDRDAGKNLLLKIAALYPYTSWKARSAYILGRELLKSGDSEAGNYLREAMDLSAIKDYVIFDMAAYYRMEGENDSALKLYDRVIDDYPLSLLKGRVIFEKAFLLAGEKDCRRAVKLLDEYIEKYPEGEFVPQALMSSARCTTESGSEERAASYVRRLLMSYPLLDDEMKAGAMEIYSGFSSNSRVGVELSSDELFKRGSFSFENRNYSQALRDLLPLAEAGNSEAAMLSARALYRLRRYRDAESVLKTYVIPSGKEMPLPDIKPDIKPDNRPDIKDAWLILAKIGSRTKDLPLILDAEKQLESLDSMSRERGKVLLMLGEYFMDKNRRSDALKIYEKTASGIDDEDIASEASWIAGWTSYKLKDYRGALEIFSSSLHRYPNGDSYDKFLYWKGRSEEKLGRRRNAEKDYMALVSKGGRGYYSQIGEERLAYIAAKNGKKKSAGRKDQMKSESVEEAWFVPSSILLNDKRYLVAEELLLLGMQEEAMAELDLLLAKYKDKREVLFNIVGIIYQMGEFHATFRIVHKYFPDFFDGGDALSELGSLAFPLQVVKYVKKRSLPGSADPFLVAAIMREESGFNPRALSPAGAMGLMQIMPETGRHLAKKSGNRSFEPEQLLDPDMNIRLGGLYLGHLKKRFKGDLVYTIASYNAGPTAVARWVRKMKMDRDEFVESIPYRETRNYTKRVIRSYSEFMKLAGDEPPGIM